ncbi:hypothetical protein [Deinococcus hopiensis]|uniref:Antibiotic biosynthesis monooxygenase n=1 Tax=Deinococcus hopiensis KR-140 TaxID=695939 RepID=A0A1W1V8Q9_9DEIO|nr:hypothetical protein [Deinococcus hopiensis]SMB89421.1 hypothetical protein SAMN00790413_00404 [Deinococcus hopiensis KR-140]
MTARIWRSTTSAEHAEDDLRLMWAVALPDDRAAPGNRGAFALYRLEGDTAHFLTLTHWELLEAIGAFAAGSVEAATTVSTAGIRSFVGPSLSFSSRFRSRGRSHAAIHRTCPSP